MGRAPRPSPEGRLITLGLHSDYRNSSVSEQTVPLLFYHPVHVSYLHLDESMSTEATAACNDILP